MWLETNSGLTLVHPNPVCTNNKYSKCCSLYAFALVLEFVYLVIISLILVTLLCNSWVITSKRN